ncbi:AdoMet-dependent rRNA methyltransferase spb1 [Bienertia sinuspersici]
MGKVKGKHRLDKFYHLAKEQGYRSRAAFKLIQLDAKYSFLHASRSVLDLCAAPGGWMQVAINRVPVGSLVIGVDLFPIRPIRGCISVEEDITKPKCRSTLKKLLSQNGFKAFDLVLHDGSPNVGGAWSQEATAQNALVIDSVKLATEFLAPKGTFVTKLFEKVEITKPIASRSTSAEIYVIGLKYKAPAKIDPRLLDIKHLFQGVVEPPKIRDIFEEGKYGDGLALVRMVCPAAEFVWETNDPAETLGEVTSISFDDPSSSPLKDHPLTTDEIRFLCEDLRVLGKQDFKQLLKWRINIQKALSPTGKTTSISLDTCQEIDDTNAEKDKGKKDDEDEDEDEDEKLLDEMEKLTHDDKARKATGMQIDALQDGYVDNELYEEQLDKALDDEYERFLAKTDGSTKQRKRAKEAYADVLLPGSGGDDDNEVDEADYDSDKAQEANPLVVPIDQDKD